MSSIRSTSSHLKGVAHPSNKANNCYNIRANTSSALETVKGGNMGGMVSAITAVFCGPGKHADKDKTLGERQYHILNGGTNISAPTHTSRASLTLSGLNSNRHHNDMDEDSTALDSSVSCDASFRTAEGSVSEFVDKFERSTGSPRIDNQRLDIPFMDESSASSSCVSSPREVKQSESYNFQNVGASEWRITDGNKRNYTEEVIEISETEYSADEEQSEVEDDHSDAEEIERTRSDTEEEGLEEEHDCDSECEHSHEEVDYESEVGSDREDIRDSDCEYIEEESAEESEYESEIEHSGSENDEEEVIEISENEASCDEEQESDNEEIIECECDSNCESDCDGNHHECSSNCGCDPYESESGDDSNDKLQLVDKPQREPPASQLNGTNHNKPLPPPRHSLNRASSFPNGDPVPSPNPVERNNNRLQRNYSQRIPQRSPEDMLGELKTALDARVRRSASCRETTIDYRKRYAHLSSNENSIAENFSKLDIKDREIRRKERRSRLRTLELKREQCLDEVRDGTEHNVTDRIYREACL